MPPSDISGTAAAGIVKFSMQVDCIKFKSKPTMTKHP